MRHTRSSSLRLRDARSRVVHCILQLTAAVLRVHVHRPTGVGYFTVRGEAYESTWYDKAKDCADGDDAKPLVLSANVTNDKAKDSADGDDSKPLVLRSRDPNVLPPSASRKLDLSPLVDAALAKRNVLPRSKRNIKKGGRSKRRR